jgi:uncharacterized protein (TIGR03437 family)
MRTCLLRLMVPLVCSGAFAAAQVNVLTANYDLQRTNANLQETTLTPSNVNTGQFGRLGAFPVDGQVYAQPLYVAGARNVVYIATMHNSVYAFDADAVQSSSPIWQVNLGPSVPTSLLNFVDTLPEIGILSTPVIDVKQQVMYLVTDTLEAGAPVFRIHALSLADGSEIKNGPAVIAATVSGTGAGSNDDGTLPFDALMELQRPGVALANGTVYLGFGSHGDGGDFHGWMFSYDASNLQRQIAVLNLSPNGYGASIWQSGHAPVIDSDGNLFVVTGNGDADGFAGFGESILKLSGKDLSVLYSYTSDSWAAWNDSDLDLGSTGAVLLSGTNLLVTGSKAGELFLVNPTAASQLGPGMPGTVQSVQVNSWGMFDIAVWNNQNGPIVYQMEPWGTLKAFQITGGQINGTPLSQTSPALNSVFCGLAISANGGTDGTGIVWQTTGDTSINHVPGTLHAFDALDLSKELWNSDMMPGSDTLGWFAKFVAPTVVNGRVYVPTFSNQVVVYGLLTNSGPPPAVIPQITSVANSASLVADAVAPGEVVSVFGANLGPAQLANLQTDATGHVTNTLAGTQVFFDGIPAALLASSTSQVNALVPFSVAGPTTQVQVQYQGQLSTPVTIPVVAAAPALFSLDGSGGGQGAILNADGSLNSWSNPAALGSIVVMYATGMGQTDPPGNDGAVTAGPPFPAPLLPISVFIDNQPAELIYAGTATGAVAGIVQINARVPYTASTQGGILVTIQAGNFLSPATVTLALQ